MSPPFDFKEYLAAICPEDQFDISRLTGGLVNFTVRACRTSVGGNTGPPAIREEQSFILKQVPSYIATLGESAPLSQYRQVREIEYLSNHRQLRLAL